MSLVLVPIFTDTFTPNANPINPSNWTTITGCSALQASAGNCEVSVSTQGAQSGAYYSGSVLPNDQYVSFKLVNLSTKASVLCSLTVRTDSGFFSGAEFEIFSNGDGTFGYELFYGSSNTSGSLVIHPGDIFTVATVGTNYYFIHNDQLLFTVNDPTSSTSGFAAITEAANGAFSDAQITDVVIGSASGSFASPYSVPDCRNYATFPNSSRNVNGTLIYDVQTPSNSAVPGVDSRAAGAPVDSRTIPNIPVNSRTPGTYGPGE